MSSSTNAPKMPLKHAYNFLQADMALREDIKTAHPEWDGKQLLSHIASRWRTMSPEERKPYEDQAAEYKANFTPPSPKEADTAENKADEDERRDLAREIDSARQNIVELVNKSVGECKDEIEELDKRFAIQESEVYQCTNFSKNIFPGVVDSRFELLSKELDITKTKLASTTSDYKSLQKQMDNQQQEIETLKQMFNTLSLSQSKQVPHSRCSTGLGFEHTVMGFESYNPFD
jgi:hypothetical protein